MLKILKQHSYYNSTLITPPENINTENYNNTINILNKLDELLKYNKKMIIVYLFIIKNEFSRYL